MHVTEHNSTAQTIFLWLHTSLVYLLLLWWLVIVYHSYSCYGICCWRLDYGVWLVPQGRVL
jgi:hypothetical protein